MKGAVLAGGFGTRLLPLTRVTNKHLLPVYDKPMIYYPLEMLARAGIGEVIVVTGVTFAKDFASLLGDGSGLGLQRLEYAYQEGAGGIADALRLCEKFANGDSLCVVLGDNILEDDITPYKHRFEEQPGGARLLLKDVLDPEHFGVAEISGDQITNIEEKPAQPKSNYAVIGVYFYDSNVFDHIRAAKPSSRNELEITDVNNTYIAAGNAYYDILRGWWTDAGRFETLLQASNLVAKGRGALLPGR